MTVKNPRNGLTFNALVEILHQDRVANGFLRAVEIGNNTTAEWVIDDHEGDYIAVTLHETKVVNVFSDDAVQLFDGGYKTKTTARRMDWFLLPLGFRMLTNNKGHGKVRWGRSASAFKVYSIQTGAYRDYSAGMVVQRGDF